LALNKSIFFKKKIVLGITASIAAYKAASICSRLVSMGAVVIPVMTPNSLNFINSGIKKKFIIFHFLIARIFF